MPSEVAIPCGAFELVEVVAAGTGGEVWRGRHAPTGTDVAIKVITADFDSDEERRQSVRREIQAQARLTHPGIVTVYDRGTIDDRAEDLSDQRLESGQEFIAMEYAPQGALQADSIDNWPDLLDLLTQLLDALAHAHARGVVHRDLKPANILAFCADPAEDVRYKIADFGIARALGDLEKFDELETRASAGTPVFMSPEQNRGDWRNFGPWTDLYALGCIAYSIVCGEPPFTGNTAYAIALQHVREPFPDLKPRFDVPDGLDEWVRRLTAKSPEERIRRAADAAWALESRVREVVSSSSVADPDEEPAPEHSESATIVDPVALTTVVLDAPSDESPAPERAHFDTSRAPFPESWRRGSVSKPTANLAAVGAGLFGIRAIPMADRTPERDAIWSGLRRMTEHSESRAVLIEGPSGIGKSRLGQWAAHRAHETGACRVIHANVRRNQSVEHAIANGLESLLSTWKLDREAVHEQIREKLGCGRTDEAGTERLARAATELLRPAGDNPAEGPQFHFGSKREILAVLGNIFERLADQRPLLLFLDDGDRGESVFQFVESILTERPELPLFVIVAICSDGWSGAGARPELDSIREVDRVDRLQLEALRESDLRRLIRLLLPLEDSLGRDIAARVDGNPLFAVQMVDSLVDRDMLEATSEGYRLPEDVPLPLPASVQELWLQRIGQLLIVFPEPARGDAHRAIRLAAAFGKYVDEPAWRNACEKLQLVVPRELTDLLVETGIAEYEPGGWRFRNSMIVEALNDDSDAEGWLADHHRVCAEALLEAYPDARRRTAKTRADHWLAAGEKRRALVPLYEAANHASSQGDLPTELDILSERAELLDSLGIGETHPRWLENRAEMAWSHLARGEFDTAEQTARDLMDDLETLDYPKHTGTTLRLLGKLASNRGQLERNLELLDDAVRASREAGDWRSVARCAVSRGETLSDLNRLDDALEAFVEAREIYRQNDDDISVLESECWIVSVDVQRERYEAARKRAEELLDEAQRLGHTLVESRCWNQLGEIARFQSRWEDARSAYRSCVELEKGRGSRGWLVAAVNAVLADLAQSNFRRVLDRVDELEDELIEVGLERSLRRCAFIRLACRAGLEHWPAWDRQLHDVREAYDRVAGRNKDDAWLAERALELTLDGDPERAQRLAPLLEDIWSAVDDQNRLAKLESLRQR